MVEQEVENYEGREPQVGGEPQRKPQMERYKGSSTYPNYYPDHNPVSDFRQAMDVLQPKGEPASARTALHHSGNYKTGPNPSPPTTNGTVDLLDRKLDYLSQGDWWAKDPNAYGKTYYYGAGIHGANFERYYNHPKFKELGFNPERNNELLYNQNSSWWDDFSRMTTSFGNLFYTGFKSPYDFGSKNTAYEFESAMATGMSTKEDVGSFFTNLALNSAYTLGLGFEMIAENWAIAGLTYATGGLATPVAVAAMGKDAMGIRKLYQMGESVKATKELLKKLMNPTTAREFYTGASNPGLLSKTVDFLNPLGNTTDYLQNLKKGTQGFDKLNDFAKTRKAFGAFYRDLREINLMTSESMMEGESARNQKNREKIDEFYRQNGYMPQGDDAKVINDQANNIAFSTSMINMPVIYFTNKLVFDGLFRGFKSPSVVGEELIQGSERTMARSKMWKIGDDAFTFQERMGKNKLASILYDNPYVPWSKKYMVGNLAEGFQETSQEIVSKSVGTYYENLYSDPSAAGFYNALVAVGEGTSDQFTMKGLETFLSGYLTGSIVQGVGGAMTSYKWAPGLYKKYLNSEQYKKEVDLRRERENSIINAVNAVAKDPLGYFSENVEHALRVKQLSRGMDEAQANGDQKSFHDNKNDLMYEHLYTLSKTGKMNMLEEHLDGLMELDDNGLTEAFNQPATEAKAIRTRLQDAKDKSMMFQATYNAVNEKFKNPFLPQAYDADKDPEQFTRELDNFYGFEAAKKDVILSTSLYGKTIERLDNLVNDLTSENMIKGANASDVTILLNQKLLNDEIETLDNEIKVLSEGNAKQKEEAQKKKEKRESLIMFRDLGMAHQQTLVSSRKNMTAEELKASKYSPGSMVRNKRTGQTIEVLEDRGPRVLVMTEKGKRKILSKKSITPVISSVRKELQESNRNLFNAFEKYMQMLANQNDTVLDRQKLISSYLKIRDHFNLREDANNMMQAANMLNNPEYFMRYAKMMAEVQVVKRENLPGYIKASYESLFEKYKNNDMMNEIFDLGVTIDPEDIRRIMQDEEYENIDFYYANTGIKLSEDDPVLEDVKKIIEKYRKSNEEVKASRKEEGTEEDDDDDVEVTETAEGPVVNINDNPSGIDTTTNAYKEVVKLFRKLEAEKIKNGETSFGLESISDENLVNDEDFIEFIKTNTRAREIMKGVESVEGVPNPEQREELDWKPQPVPKGLEKLKNLFNRVLYLTEDGKNYFDEDGVLWDRVSAMKDQDAYANVPDRIKRRAQHRGNVIDKVLRELFKGTIETKADMIKVINNEIRTNRYEIQFDSLAHDQLFDIISEIKTTADTLRWKVHSEIPVLSGMFPGLNLPQEGRIAGTIDLLVEIDGEFMIIDIKTATVDRSSPEGRSRYLASDTLQLNAYRELIEKATGVKIAGIMVFPLTVTQTGQYRNINEIVAPKFKDEGMIPIPIIPVRELVPDLFGEAEPAGQPAETAASSANDAPTVTDSAPAAKPAFKGDELQKIIDEANTAKGYEDLKKKLYRILNSDPHMRDHFGLNAAKVKEILAEKFKELNMTFTLTDIQAGLSAKTVDGQNVEIVKKTKDTFTIKPIGGTEETVYSNSAVYDVIKMVNKPGMQTVEPETQAAPVEVLESTQEVSDKSIQDGQLTAEKVNALNAEVNEQTQDDIDDDVINKLCPTK